MRPQECHGAISPWLPGHLNYFDAGLLQRMARLQLEAGIVIRDRVVIDPVVEEPLSLNSRHEAADLVAHDGLEIMREARDGEDVRELRRDARVRRGGVLV